MVKPFLLEKLLEKAIAYDSPDTRRIAHLGKYTVMPKLSVRSKTWKPLQLFIT